MKTTDIFLLATVITLFTTVNLQAQDYQEFAVIRDLSTSQKIEEDNFQPSTIMAKTIGRLDLKNNGKGYGFYSSCIGQDAYPKVNKVILAETNYWITPKNKRKAAVELAKVNLTNNLGALSEQELSYEYSSLYRGIIHTISHMDKKCKKTVYIYTDGIESYIVDFYGVMDWNDQYKDIKERLLADIVVPEVTNLEIVFICSGKDEKTVQATRFWIRFFNEFKIKASVRAAV